MLSLIPLNVDLATENATILKNTLEKWCQSKIKHSYKSYLLPMACSKKIINLKSLFFNFKIKS